MKGQAALFSAQTVHWPTPEALLDELRVEFGDLEDPAPLGGTKAFFEPWGGGAVFVNPPYGRNTARWLQKARGEVRLGRAKLVIMLLPARTDTAWFHDEVLPFAHDVRFIRKRLKFGGSKINAPFPSMLVIYKADG